MKTHDLGGMSHALHFICRQRDLSGMSHDAMPRKATCVMALQQTPSESPAHILYRHVC